MGSKQVLIVDDEPRVTRVLGKVLENSPSAYHVRRASNGQEALKIIAESPMDLLVTDLRMPGFSGLELIRKVRSSYPETRIILITAYGDSQLKEEVRRLEISNYITKPFGIEEFASAVQKALKDSADGEPRFTILCDDVYDEITHDLTLLKEQIGAHCIYLSDMQGRGLSQVGSIEGLKSSTLLGLLAGGFSTTAELDRQFGDGEADNLNFYRGSEYEVYSSSIEDEYFLAMIFTPKDEKGRIGLVWLYTQRAIKKLRKNISQSKSDKVPTIQKNFTDRVGQELDRLFNEEECSPSDSAQQMNDAAQKTSKETWELHTKPLGGESPEFDQD